MQAVSRAQLERMLVCEPGRQRKSGLDTGKMVKLSAISRVNIASTSAR